MGHGNGLELETIFLRKGFQRDDRFLAIGAVMIDEADLLALQVGDTAHLLCDVLDRNVRRGPVAAKRNEIPRKHAAILALRPAVTKRQQRYLVAGHLLRQREGDAGRQRREVARAGSSLSLQALIAFDSLVGGVPGLAFLG